MHVRLKFSFARLWASTLRFDSLELGNEGVALDAAKVDASVHEMLDACVLGLVSQSLQHAASTLPNRKSSRNPHQAHLALPFFTRRRRSAADGNVDAEHTVHVWTSCLEDPTASSRSPFTSLTFGSAAGFLAPSLVVFRVRARTSKRGPVCSHRLVRAHERTDRGAALLSCGNADKYTLNDAMSALWDVRQRCAHLEAHVV